MKLHLIAFFSFFLLFAQEGFAQDDELKMDFIEVTDKPETDEETVFTIVEVMPTYPGGDFALVDFIGRTVEYPEKGKKKDAGTVYVSYVIDTNGDVIDAKVIRGLTEPFNNAALDAVRKIKGYQPGTQNGKPVKVMFVIPIRFD